jgi:hypothetical protein
LIQAWSEGSIDEETGEPLGDSLARASEVAGAAVTAISIHFEFAITEVPVEGEYIRLTAHIVEDLLVWEGEPMGIFPIDPIEWVIIVPGETLDGVNILIENGDDGGGTTGDGGVPTDTGLPPLDGGGGSGDEGGGPGPTG